MKKRITAGILFIIAVFSSLLIQRKMPVFIQCRLQEAISRKHDRSFSVDEWHFSISDFCFHGMIHAAEEDSLHAEFIISFSGYVYDTWSCRYAADNEAQEISSLFKDTAEIFCFADDNTIQIPGSEPDISALLKYYPDESFTYFILTEANVSSMYAEIDNFIKEKSDYDCELVMIQMDSTEIAAVRNRYEKEALTISDFTELVSSYTKFRIPV